MKIYFARHGESQANILHQISNRSQPHGLTLKGKEEALRLATRLCSAAVSQIYSSPVQRAVETSTIVASRLGIRYEITDALREFDCGIAEGRSDEGAWRLWHAVFDAWLVDQRYEQRIEGGESFQQIRDRFVPFVEQLVTRYGDTPKEILCIAHAGLYWMMLPQVLRNVNYELIASRGLNYTTCIVTELYPSGLYCIDWNGLSMDPAPLE
jgi:broad specificity phosphatase PhoE